MPLTPLNPYGSKGMLRDLTMFFGRTNVLRHIYAEIRDRQCISIVGPRRIGKSSVLGLLSSSELQQRLGHNLNRCLFTFIDLEERLQETCEDFFGFVMKQLVVQSQGRLSLELPQGNGAEEFRDFLDQVKVEGYYPVLLLDEFDSITINTNFDYSFFYILRAQANAGKVSYVTASKEPLQKVCHTSIYGSPFFNLFSTQELGLFTQQEAIELITLPSQRAGHPFTAMEVEWILKLSGRHPFFLQCACYYLFEAKCGQTDTATIDFKDIAKQVYNQLLPHFTYTWDHLNSQSRELLQWEARREKVVQRKLPTFSESLLFRQFIRKVCSIELSSITVNDVCKIMDNLNDLHFLGQSKLGYLNLVYMRLHDSDSVSLIDKGAIVDELLQSAVETLRPEGSPRDSQNEWRLYNILNWRHRDKLQNEEIAARLGIGLRHYYRECKKAAKVLLNVLLKMEIASKLEMDS